MTNNEAAKWIQLYIDLAKIDPTTGEAAYLNDDDKKTIEAMEMAINALTAQAEIIRCKDCKHQVKEWRTDKRLKDNGYMVCGCDVVGDACGYWALLGQDDDYCSMSERKGNG